MWHCLFFFKRSYCPRVVAVQLALRLPGWQQCYLLCQVRECIFVRSLCACALLNASGFSLWVSPLVCYSGRLCRVFCNLRSVSDPTVLKLLERQGQQEKKLRTMELQREFLLPRVIHRQCCLLK